MALCMYCHQQPTYLLISVTAVPEYMHPAYLAEARYQVALLFFSEFRASREDLRKPEQYG